MKRTDKRGRLDTNPFDYHIDKKNVTRIYYEGRHIMTLSNDKTLKLQGKLQGLDDHGIQLVLAKVTGHFKH